MGRSKKRIKRLERSVEEHADRISELRDDILTLITELNYTQDHNKFKSNPCGCVTCVKQRRMFERCYGELEKTFELTPIHMPDNNGGKVSFRRHAPRPFEMYEDSETTECHCAGCKAIKAEMIHDSVTYGTGVGLIRPPDIMKSVDLDRVRDDIRILKTSLQAAQGRASALFAIEDLDRTIRSEVINEMERVDEGPGQEDEDHFCPDCLCRDCDCEDRS